MCAATPGGLACLDRPGLVNLSIQRIGFSHQGPLHSLRRNRHPLLNQFLQKLVKFYFNTNFLSSFHLNESYYYYQVDKVVLTNHVKHTVFVLIYDHELQLEVLKVTLL